MAISAGMVWQVQNGGSDTTCSGGFRGGANLSTPSAPSVAATAGGSVSAATYYVVVTESDMNGETPKSAETAVTTSGGNLTITVTSPTNPNSTGATWNVYVGTATGGPYFLQNTSSGLAFGANRVVTATPPTSGTQAPGVDYSQQNGAQVNIDNAAITATTTGANSNTLTFTLGYTPTAADVGNTFQPSAGTNINLGVYEITGFSATTWTLTGAQNLTTAGGAGSAIVGKMGGAFASPGMGAKFAVSANGLFVKYNATPYSCSSSTNVSGGCISSGNLKWVVSYDTTRDLGNTDANRSTFNAASNSMALVTLSTSHGFMANIIAAVNGHTSVTGFALGSQVAAYNCVASGVATGYAMNNGNGFAQNCLATGCTGNGFSIGNVSSCHDCVALGTTAGSGFTCSGNAGAVFVNCCSIGSVGASSDGFTLGDNFGVCVSCVAYGNGGIGFNISTSGPSATCTNCISYGNTGVGYAGGTVTNLWASKLLNCAGGGNSSNFSGLFASQIVNFQALSAGPFTNAAGNDFSLNSTAGGGALCKAAGIPGSTASTQLPGLSSLAYPDIGAVQSTVAASTAPVGQITGARSIGTY